MSSTQLVSVNTQSPVAFGEMERMAEAFAKSGLFGLKTRDQALALMVVAQAEGRHPGSVATEYHVIQGRASLKADAMLARFQAAGGKVEWKDYTDTRVSGVFSHPQGGTLEVDWDMARAKAAGLGTKDNWRTYPRQMLRARCISDGIRGVYPGVLQGMYTPEEVGEFKPEPRVAVAAMVTAPVVEVLPEPEVEAVAEAPKKKVRYKHIPNPPEQEGEVVAAEPAPAQEAEWAKELEKRCFEYEPRVNSFLVAKGLVGEGQTFRDIKDQAYIQRVLANTPRFIEAVVKFTEVKEAA
jgi:hypothetical protein